MSTNSSEKYQSTDRTDNEKRRRRHRRALDQHYLVADREECNRCGDEIRADKEGEYRHRFVLEDSARSSGSILTGKLCSECWWTVARFVEGRR